MNMKLTTKLHHSTHSWLSRHCRFIFLFVNDQALCCKEHTSNRSCIFQSDTSYLCRINYTSSTQVFKCLLTSIVTEVTFALANLLNDYCTFTTSIDYNLTQRFLYGTLYNINTSLLICIITFNF